MTGNKLVRMIQRQIKALLPRGIELGTVTVPWPNIRIALAHGPIELTKDDLIICEHILRHDRIVSIEHKAGESRNLGDKTVMAIASGNITITAPNMPPKSVYVWDNGTHQYLKLQYKDVLKKGDRVVLMALQEEQKYLVWDRVVI